MDDLENKLEELLKGLFALKEQQGPLVPAIKPPKLGGAPKAGAAPTIKVSAPKAPPKIAGGLPPASKKDPTKVAEQLKEGVKPQKVSAPEVLKIENNGQWSLSKALNATKAMPDRTQAATGVTVAAPKTTIINPQQTAVAPHTTIAGTTGGPSFKPKPTPAPTTPPASPRQSAGGTVPLRPRPQGNVGVATPNTPASATEAVDVTKPKSTEPLSAAKHGWLKTHSPIQNSLLEGLTLHDAKPIGKGLQGAAFANSNVHKASAIVKNSAMHEDKEMRGHVKNGFNSARREVLYHDLAHKFFGLGDHVPTTAGFTKDGEDWSAQQKVDGASHTKFIRIPKDDGMGSTKIIANANHEKILRDLNNSGQMDKLSMMDHLSGHHDRHGGNFLLDDAGSGMHLIDNGTAFDYGNLDRSAPIPHYRQYVQDLGLHGPGGHESHKQFHPEAQKWLSKLNPENAKKIFAEHGHDENSPAMKGFMARLEHLRGAAAGTHDGINSTNGVLGDGRFHSHQEPHEFVDPEHLHLFKGAE
jgi:hypothetical protein